MIPNTAHEHAIRASEYMAHAESRVAQIGNVSREHDAELEVKINGAIKLAKAHALTSLALSMSEEDPNPDDATGRFDR